MKDKIMAKATKIFYSSKLCLKKHSPEILLAVGIAGTVTSAVMACKETLKVKDILDEKNDTVEKIHTVLEKSQKGKIKESYTEEDAQRDLSLTYVQTTVKLIKLYAPSVLLGSLSISSIVAGHKILSKRNAAIAAAYAVVDKGFKTYRKNVVERFGEDVDKELRLGIKADKVSKDKNLSKNESGKKPNSDKYIDCVNQPEIEASQYSRFFDSGSCEFQKDPEYNMMFLRRQQDYANELLRTRGYLFLNEVYDLLDIPRSKAGQIVGWIFDKDHPENEGDGYVDFGLYNGSEANRRFVNGEEYNILLDFNVDGVIYDKL